MRTINTKPKHNFEYSQMPNPLTFAMLDGDQYIHSPVMCKDYLQDIFWSLRTQRPVRDIHGLAWAPEWLPARDRFEVALAGTTVLVPRCVTMQGFLNLFDTALGIEPTLVTPTTDEKIVVVNFSAAWTESGPLVSALTTLVRLSGGWKGEDVRRYLKDLLDRGPMEKSKGFGFPKRVLWTPDPVWMKPDIERLSILAPRVLALLAGKRPNHPWKGDQGIHSVHSEGILGFMGFPEVKL